ncbi:MAG: zinc ABC transporter solute-binding protein [Clostridiales bacterium]|nr:zinc ABC transporter solute-binding protein [Clostridiales bacterium]
MNIKLVDVKLFIIIILLLALIMVSACGQSTSQSSNKPTIAVSIVPQSTFVKEVAGDLVDVVTMIPPGSSPETYSATPNQLKSFSHASIYFTIGIPSEEASILPKAKDFNPDLKIVDLAKHVSEVYPDLEIAPGERDPHIWLSPKRVKVMIDVIAEELSKLDPENKDTYNNNAQRYKEQLDQLDTKIRDSLTDLKIKTFIAYHPAFGYFADDYDLEMIALEEEGKEASPQTFENIVDMAKEKGIKVIFYQAEVDSRQAETFATEIGGKTEKIAPLAPDYIENLERMANTFAQVMK